MKPKYWNKGIKYLSNKDKILKKLINSYPKEYLSLNSNYFHSLINSIIGQQISVSAADSIKKNFFNLNTSITPKFSTSKIFVMVNIGQWDSTGLNQRGSIRLVRDSTAICVGDSASNRTRSSATTFGQNSNTDLGGLNICFMDSPSTTSAVTYKVQSQTEGSYTTYINRSASDADSSSISRSASTVTLMEISA